MPVLGGTLAYVPDPDTCAPMVDHQRRRIGRALCTVADAPAGTVVVHCQAGKDRTGVLVALMLAVAGVGADGVRAPLTGKHVDRGG